MEHQFLTVSQAARLLDLSSDSIRRFEREGILPAIRVGKNHRLFTHSDVERLRLEREKKSNQQLLAG
jgi:excisionase family DNA binding protein